MKRFLIAALFSISTLGAAAVTNAQTPGVPIATPFAVIDGQPHEIGAYYRKVITASSTANLGVYSRDGIIPEFAEDQNRFFIQEIDGTPGHSLAEMNDYRTGSRDRPSIYMGGRNSSNVEIDAGVAWNRVFAIVTGETAARATWTTDADASSRTDQYVIVASGGQFVVKNLQGVTLATASIFAPATNGAVSIGGYNLRPNFAFRPMFRSSDLAGNGNGGYHTIATAGGANDSQFYHGETFMMELKKLQTGQIRLTVSGVQQTVYAATVAGFASGAAVYKRVDSIDQKGRERLAAEPTNGTVVRGGWGVTSVLKTNGNQPFAAAAGTTVKSVEFSQNTYNYLFGPIGQGRATRTDGSEVIYINPPNP